MPASHEHVAAVSAALRTQDRITVMACGLTAEGGYGLLLTRSMFAETALLDGEPAAMWGAAADSFMATDKAHLWMLVRRGVHRPPLAICRIAVRFIREMLAHYGRVTTTVLEGFVTDQRFIEWLGFKRCAADDIYLSGRLALAYSQER